MKRIWAIAAISLVMAGCSQTETIVESTAPPITATTTTVEPTTTTAPATTTTTTIAADAVPEELAGSWTTEISGVEVMLQLNRNFYSIQRDGNTGSGKASVTGNQITFSDSNLCSGVGIYTWVVEGETLTLSPEGSDACPGRASAIRDKTYTRA